MLKIIQIHLMKNFLEFLTEAGTSQASSQAQKLNLKSDGHGGWLDSRGNFVAKTEKGKLKFYNARERKAEEGPVKQMATARADDKLAGAPNQQPAPQQKAAKPDPEASDLDKTLDTLTLAFGRFNPPTAGHEKLIQAAEKQQQVEILKYILHVHRTIRKILLTLT